ncbi:MAG: polysaccharide biosynthesis/export family protein [Gemmatimonas sp.]
MDAITGVSAIFSRHTDRSNSHARRDRGTHRHRARRWRGRTFFPVIDGHLPIDVFGIGRLAEALRHGALREAADALMRMIDGETESNQRRQETTGFVAGGPRKTDFPTLRRTLQMHTTTMNRIARVASALSLALLFVLAGCAQQKNLPPLEAAADPAEYRLGAGDRIAVTVFGEDMITGEYDVDNNGAVNLPLVGAVDAKSKTPRQFERDLRGALIKGGIVNNAQVSVNVTKYRPFFVLGEVQKPGAYPYYAGATVLNAVAMAGGYTYRAATNSITVTRNDNERSAKEQSLLQPGDIVTVPLRWF